MGLATPSPPPTRYPSGVSTDQAFGPLANYGAPNPFLYHTWADDFDSTLFSADYTKTLTGNGTVAQAAGDGGLALFTTNSSTPATTDVASIQLPVAGFQYTAGKKMFFMARVQMSDVTNGALLAGLMQTSATPFTVADGIVFTKPTGAANNLTLSAVVGGVATSIAIPLSAYTLANNTNIDLAFYVDRNGVIYVFVNAQLIGWIPQSNGGQRGPVASLQPAALTAVVLNPTLALQSGTASSKTMTADILFASKER